MPDNAERNTVRRPLHSEMQASSEHARRAALQAVEASLVAVRAVLAMLPANDAPAAPLVYTTAKSGPGVPGKSRSWALRNLKTVRAAYKVGRDWLITGAEWEAWLRSQDAARVRPRPASRGAPDDEVLIEAATRTAGLRQNGGAR